MSTRSNSRHVLPSKQFFTPRRPIRPNANASAMRKTTSSSTLNSPSSSHHTSSQMRLPFTSVVGTTSSESNSEEVGIARLTLPRISTTLDLSLDYIIASNSGSDLNFSLPEPPPSALLARRQTRTDIPQAVIDSVLEPIDVSTNTLKHNSDSRTPSNVTPRLSLHKKQAPFLYSHVSPAVVAVFIYLFLLALSSMLITSWTDPGIIPRNLDPSPPREEFDDGDHYYNLSQYSYVPTRSLPLPKNIRINGYSMVLKYCETCKIYRPPRCSHCRQCNNCVENEDHHCIWLNNCIGRRNYRSFFTFILTATILCIYVAGFSLAHIILLLKENDLSFLGVLRAAPMRYPFISFLLVWSVGGLSGYHIYLVSHNLTTHEQLRAPLARRNGLRNQYDFGSTYKNCLWVLCRPLVHSSINRRGFVESDLVEDRETQDDGTSADPQMTSATNLSLAGPSRTNQDRVNVNVA
ncbi:2525_t:CDS:2 [Ambispora gerdemannii]|uniref:Palmitoyltransferase n=1 Tax=Ambispora gerdemannii TaxID=144530 RepID=A0A9N8V9B9_9GLOM|nr:2525_t:CDS:2 [Ambispora gerdemannii]